MIENAKEELVSVERNKKEKRTCCRRIKTCCYSTIFCPCIIAWATIVCAKGYLFCFCGCICAIVKACSDLLTDACTLCLVCCSSVWIRSCACCRSIEDQAKLEKELQEKNP
uniref:Uncharacterized protein n=1 Tax=Lotharella globosa TaxID=91324 RepID=A0A6V3ULP8_9EUKA|mmetsp:Transcript_12612/g.24605  ORF Transcript_12612/g.24605 Transcript_12612/m.24605 type:complete len:111 (+) Transcript_12612:42-374(+)